METKLCIVIALTTLVYSQPSIATTFQEMPISEKVERAPIIVVGTIEGIRCIDESKNPLPAGKNCTAPGSKNKMHYSFRVTEVLKDTTSYFKEIPSIVDFEFTSMAHTLVPEDNYRSAVGLERIAYLYQKSNELHPMHEAFYFDELNKKIDVLKNIYLRNLSVEAIGDFLFVKANNAESSCFALNVHALKILSSYDVCEKNSSGRGRFTGVCKRKDRSEAYLFSTMNDCKTELKVGNH